MVPRMLQPVVRLEKLSKTEIHQLTKQSDRTQNLRKFIQKTRAARRDSFERIRIKRQEDLLQDQLQKFQKIREFLECGLNNNNDDEPDKMEILELQIADIGRDYNFSETSSVSGGSTCSRRGRMTNVPDRFTIEYEPPKPKTLVPKATFEPGTKFDVESIWNMNLIDSEVAFEVKWVNYPPRQNTWEPLDNVRHCEFLEEFLDNEMKGLEDLIQSDIESILKEKAKEIEDIYAKGKKSVIKEIENFDALLFRAYKPLYRIVCDDQRYYKDFKKKFKRMVIVDHFRKLHIVQLASHKTFAEDIMMKESNTFKVNIENDVDFISFEPFEYVKEQIIREGVQLNKNVDAQGCKCEEGCSKTSNCCPKTEKSNFAYKTINKKNRLRLNHTTMIFECDEKCSCGADCLNRVTQQPRKIPITIFKTKNYRGWGLRTRTSIAKGTFLMEYTGEVVTQEESIRRGQKYDEISLSYLFDLDYNDNSEATYTIDAFKCGNISRLINHSCDPNCRIWPVTTCSEDPFIYKICFFSSRFIKEGEELTFDYQGGGVFEADEGDLDEGETETANGGNLTRRYQTKDDCRCGSFNCRGKIFG